MFIRGNGSANRCDLEGSHTPHIRRCGPEVFPQKTHPMEGRAPVCKDMFTGVSVTASHGTGAKSQTNKPNNLDTNTTSLFGSGG